MTPCYKPPEAKDRKRRLIFDADSAIQTDHGFQGYRYPGKLERNRGDEIMNRAKNQAFPAIAFIDV
jgi:hypothetical protein